MFYIEFIDDSAYVSPTELTFPVEGGTQTVTIKVPGYKYFDFSINDEDKSWLSAKTVKGGYLEITAEPNDTGEERVGSVHCFIYNEENPTEEQKEYIMLGLRKIEGVSIQNFKNKFVDNPIYVFRKELEELVNKDLLEIDLDSIKLTDKGLDLANVVWEKFI